MKAKAGCGLTFPQLPCWPILDIKYTRHHLHRAGHKSVKKTSTMAYSPRRMSDTTYRSYHDVEMVDPLSSPPSTSRGRQPIQSLQSPRGHSPTIVQVQRKDSGYESHTSSPRNSATYFRPKPTRRSSGLSKYGTSSAQSLRSPIRPAIRRPATSQTATSYQLRPVGTGNQLAYYQFPTSDLVEVTETSQEAPECLLATADHSLLDQ